MDFPAMPAIHPSGHGYCMPGCLPANRSLILNGKRITCDKSFQITNWFPTSDPASTSRGLACVPYWDERCADLSQRLWSPTGTGSRELDSASWSTSCTQQDAFSQSLKIRLATDVRRNSQKTSLQCSPTLPPSTTGDGRTVVRKIELRPNPAQREAFRFFCGANRFFWNKTKSVADKVSQEAHEARCAELAHNETGTCQLGDCHRDVKDPAAPHDYKARWWCPDHVDDVTFGAKARIMPRSRPYERLSETFDGVCRTIDCDQEAEEGKFRCRVHSETEDAKKDPKQPKPVSPYNFEGIKSIVQPPSEELLDHEKWQEMVPSNTKSAAIKAYTSACSSTFTKWRNGDMSAELPAFKSRRDKVQEFAIRNNAISFRRIKPASPPKKKRRGKHKSRSGRKLKSRYRCPRPRGDRRQGWELRIFARQSILKGKEADASRKLAQAMSEPIRLRRQDMVRLKRARQIGATGSQDDWCESTVQRDYGGRYHLLLPIKMTERDSSPVWRGQSYRDVFLDPGGRTFVTAYSPEGVAAKIGDDFYGKLLPTLRRADRTMAYAQKHRRALCSRKYRSLLRRAHALRTKVRNCVRDLHRKTARFLCANFTAIFVPNFAMGRIASTTQLSRRISSSSIRNLMTFAHGEFMATLQSYAQARGVHVIVVGEAYTTKTCPWCGHQNCVGSKKTYKCTGCGTRIDRDLGAGQSIAIRTTRFSE